MHWERHQLTALATVVRTGSFEAAARELSVTPSAVSQRIRALENAAGQVLVRRGKPSTATEAGQVLVRVAEQTELLEEEARAELHGTQQHPSARMSVAVNADSLSTWFLPVVVSLADAEQVLVELYQEDEDHTAQLLRDGSVMAAVTAEPAAVQGCRSVRIGAMRYRPMASHAFHDRYVAPSSSLTQCLATAPMLNFDRRDTLQLRYLRGRTRRSLRPPTHYVPASASFTDAVRRGLGWGMIPEHHLHPDEDQRPDGLVALDDSHLDVALYWQHWRIESNLLNALTTEVRTRAAEMLR